MTWRTHLLGGVGSLWLLRPVGGFYPVDNWHSVLSTESQLGSLGLLAALAGLGALLPDLDAQDRRLSISPLREASSRSHCPHCS